MVALLKKSITTLVAALFAASLLYYLHPYYGIRHDSPLYLGQALLAIDPDNFKKDLFFAYGSQADYTILPRILGWLCTEWHPASVFICLTAFSLLLFAVSAFALTRELFGREFGYWALLALLIFPSVYAGNWIMSYAESFLTGRALSEPLVLLLLLAYLRHSYGLASLLFVIAALIHPLQALGGVMVIWAHLVLQRRVWLNLLWLPLIFIVAAMLGAPHLEFLSARFDSIWFEWIQGPNKLTFLSQWSKVDWNFILADVFLLSLWSVNKIQPMQSLSRASMLATGLGFVLSYILYEHFQFVFIGGLQLWRVDWLLHWFAVASIPILLWFQYGKTGLRSFEFVSLLTIVALGTQNRISPDMGQIIYILIPMYFVWPRISNKVGQGLTRALIISMPLAILLALLKFSQQAYDRYHASWHLGNPPMMHFMVLSHPVIGGLCIVALIYFYKRLYRYHWLGVGLVSAALIFSVVTWDRRSAWTLEIEHTHGDGREFGVKLEPGAQVFWSNELLAPWLVLRRPSYFSAQQTAGILFNRNTARDVMKRHAALDALNGDIDLCKSKSSNGLDDEVCSVQGITLTNLCRVAGSDLDYIVLDFQSSEKYAGVWNLSSRDNAKRPISYYLYRCSDLVPNAAPVAP